MPTQRLSLSNLPAGILSGLTSCALSIASYRKLLTKMFFEPISNCSKLEFTTLERLNHEVRCLVGLNVQVVTIHQQKSVSGRKSDSFVSIQKWVIVR